MKALKNILTISVIETLVFWVLVKYFYIPKLYENPEIVSSQNLLIIVAFTNLILFVILTLNGKSKFRIPVLVNILLAPLILMFILTKTNQNYLSNRFTGGTFKYQNAEYLINVDKKKQNFLLTKTDLNNSQTNILSGKIEIQKNKIILIAKPENYIIENDSIKGIEGKNFKLK